MYKTLNDAAVIEPILRAPDDPEGPRVEIWYAKNPDFTGLGPFRPWKTYLGEPTHIKVGEIALSSPFGTGESYVDPDSVFIAMQGERWSPNAEARALIESLGLRHTSMSVGDVLVFHAGSAGTVSKMCDIAGWRNV